jgi:hypothetical protein
MAILGEKMRVFLLRVDATAENNYMLVVPRKMTYIVHKFKA